MTISRVQLSSLENGTILISATFRPAAGATAFVYLHGTETQVTVYSAETGSPTLSQPLTADSNGELPGFVLAEQDLDVVATYEGHSAGPAESVPLRALDLVGTDPGTGLPALGAGMVPLSVSVVTDSSGSPKGIDSTGATDGYPLTYDVASDKYKPKPGGGSSAPQIIQGGDLSATASIAAGASQEKWLVATLVTDTILTVTGIVAGGRVKALLTQDDPGGHAFRISDGTTTPVAVEVPQDAAAFFAVDIDCPNSTDLLVTPLSVPGPSGDGSALPAGGAALQVVGKDAASSYGWLSTLQIVLTPSEDTTGATDRAAINAALASYATVILHSPGSRFWVDQPIVANTDNNLILWNARVSLIDGANCNIVTNSNATLTGGTQNYGGTPDSGIRVKGVGVGWLDGNASNQDTPVAPNTLSQVGVFWCNATDVGVEDVIIGPVAWMAGCSVGTSDLRWSRVNVNQDRAVLNQDGIDVGPGCTNIQIEHTRGKTGDDCHSIWAKHGAVVGAANLCPWLTAAYTAGATNLNSSDIRIVNSNVDVGVNCVRVQAGDGAMLSGVHVSDFVKRGSLYAGHLHSVLQFGTLTYVTTPPTSAQLTDITLDGFSGPTDYLIGADSNFSDVVVRNAHITGPFTALMGHTAGTPTTAQDVEIDASTSDPTGAANYGLKAISGDAWNRVKLRARMKSSKAVLANAGAVTNLDLDAEVSTPTSAPLQSTVAETGRLQRLVLGARPSVVASVAHSLKQGRDAPYLTATDTVPAPITGSELLCRYDLDPTGGSHGISALYVGDGSVWNRIIDLPYLGAPSITGLSLTAGSITGGDTVVISGANFTGATAVKFGATNAASFTVNSSTQITAVTPAKSAGTVDVTITTPIGTSVTSTADQFRFAAASAIAFVKNGGTSAGPSGGGSASTITLTVPSGGHAAGNLLVVCAGNGSSSGTVVVSNVTDSRGNSYTIDSDENANNLRATVVHSILSTALQAGDMITITCVGNEALLGALAAEFSGTLASPVDQAVVNAVATATTALDGGTTGATSQAVELAVAVFDCSGDIGAVTWGGGFALLNTAVTMVNGSTRQLVAAYKILSSVATVDCTGTATTAHAFSAATATYKGA